MPNPGTHPGVSGLTLRCSCQSHSDVEDGGALLEIAAASCCEMRGDQFGCVVGFSRLQELAPLPCFERGFLGDLGLGQH